MSKIAELIKAIHNVMRLQDDVASLAKAIEKIADRQAEMDRRLARIEGMAEMSFSNRRISKKVPK